MNIVITSSKQLSGLVGAGMVALVTMGACATQASAGPLSASLTSQEYAQISETQCAGIPAKEQQLGVLAFRDAIASTQPLKEEFQVGKTKLSRDRGVQLTIRAQPELSGPWLARVATCHMALARAGALPAAETDPQLVAGATVSVEEAYTGYVVSVRVPDQTAAIEVMRRTTLTMAAPTGLALADRTTH
jgi:hypothetical protein